ncbi:MAG: hypothetical protein J0I07_23515 [Myxococcales bacterium]|nr:hypothetical protein [Myxococcales bacterium]
MSHARRMCLVIPIVIAACHAHPKEPTSESRLTAAERSIPSGPVAAAGDRLLSCPSVVPGATTLVSEVPEGVELKITGTGDATTNEIRRRGGLLRAAAEETRGEHQGSGAGNGRFGRCPVVMRNTRIDVREIPNGAAIVLKPSHPTELAWLRREVEARSAQLASPKLFGPGLMKTCPSAVPNAETTVTNAAYGVDVKVTEGTPAGVRAIRERAKELAAHPVRDERCPINSTDATLTVSEIPGGVSIAVKPKRREDMTLLRHDVLERARSYEAPATR